MQQSGLVDCVDIRMDDLMKKTAVGIKMTHRIVALLVCLAIASISACSVTAETADPLPSWTDGAAKQKIEQFVGKVTTAGGADFVPPEGRIAVFDNDGTLWSERPWVEGEFMKYQIRQAAVRNPSRRDTQPFKAALENDQEFFKNGGWPVIVGPARKITAQMSREEYDAEIVDFFASEKHLRFDIPYQQTIYQPALELIWFLRANGFSVYICSGGGVDFMRMISAELYGIGSDKVIGSSLKKELHKVAGKWVLVTTDEVNVFNNKDKKAVNIDLHIGKRPLLVMGNVGGKGDLGMLGYSQSRDGLSLQLLVNHDDEVREFAYAEEDNESLHEAETNGWIVISMKEDWSLIYPSR